MTTIFHESSAHSPEQAFVQIHDAIDGFLASDMAVTVPVQEAAEPDKAALVCMRRTGDSDADKRWESTVWVLNQHADSAMTYAYTLTRLDQCIDTFAPGFRTSAEGVIAERVTPMLGNTLFERITAGGADEQTMLDNAELAMVLARARTLTPEEQTLFARRIAGKYHDIPSDWEVPATRALITNRQRERAGGFVSRLAFWRHG